ncbi:iron chaperone [Paenibacillus xanthanilyticus]|uniref:Iron chaperone n=1 Tax=Paenibacillus xanthanilyticus TaxID=1783531 RepID=A0ABV8JYW9_9BACL
MEEIKHAPDTIDAYIAGFAPDIRERLQALRNVIKEAAPDATEKISYRMPTFELHGNLVHFAAFANHIGFYPTPSGIAAFQEELSVYQGAKGSVQFPLDQPLPLDLVRAIVRYRVAENIEQATKKKS